MARPKKTLSTKPETDFTYSPAKEKISHIVEPLIRSNGEKHILETILDGDEDEYPEMKAIGFMRLDSNRTHGWVSYTMTVKGDRVTRIEISEPDMRDIAQESSKTDFVQNFMDKDL